MKLRFALPARPSTAAQNPEQNAPRFSPRRRIWGLIFFFTIATWGVLIRAFILGGEPDRALEKLAANQHDRTLRFAADRGAVLDRNRTQLAVSVETVSAFVNPKLIDDPRPIARRLGKFFREPDDVFLKNLSADRYFSWIKRQISQKEFDALKQIVPKGLGSVAEKRRFYPQRMLASHLLGYVGVEGNGLDGLEAKFDTLMKGETRWVRLQRDAKGRPIDLEGQMLTSDTLAGNTLVLTIDSNIQHVVERELENAALSTRAKSASVVVMDPKSGDVLAMANFPTFDPNAFQLADAEARRNRAIVDVFEPGSIFKVFIMAKALEKNLVSLHERINCENGRYRVPGGKILRDVHPHGDLTPAEIIKYSSNIGMYKIAQRFKPKDFYDAITAFGFGEKTGLGLQGESRGMLRPPSQWHGVVQGNLAFGQGVAVTSIQLARAYSALAAQGTLLRPRVLRDLEDPSGKSYGLQNGPRGAMQALNKRAADDIVKMMMGVTEEGGTGVLAAMPGFRVAGKTGTSQKSDGHGGYSPDHFVSSFAGFVPAENPKLVITVMIDDPEGTTYGGVVAAPVFRRIAEQALLYLGVQPSGPLLAQARTPSLTAPSSANPGLMLAAVHGIEHELQARPAPLVLESTARHGVRVPEVKGLTLREALQELQRENIAVRIEGSGTVVDQKPSGGEWIAGNREVVLRAQPQAPTLDGLKQTTVQPGGKRI